MKFSRQAKLHIGGYFDPTDQTIVAFQKLKIDLRQSQQEMLFEALRDFFLSLGLHGFKPRHATEFATIPFLNGLAKLITGFMPPCNCHRLDRRSAV